MLCTSCQAENSADSRFCKECGAPLTPEATPTVSGTGLRKRSPNRSSSTSNEGRFQAGSILADRYRILGLLGRGGMGEVYQAYDTTLDQSVALKFLPQATTEKALLERFRGEVRIARQVSHPNVCRVYDLGEADGMPFISMEYVDGEDLRSLLRRIGRLPGDKAVEIARRLCAGLAAAHAKGVLHRDLKPANIMIDSQGQVQILDFGLAAIADEIEERDFGSGTPAYRAPEQLEGREVTVRSDIYSLGLVLFEMFTGRRAFDGPGERSAPPNATSVVQDIDPGVEKVIRRCLEPNPVERPASALDVARALPGGDPLAEALAAGETPSPEMVAGSEDTGTLTVRSALLCLAFIVVGLAVAIPLSDRTHLLRMIPLPNPPEVLGQRARDIAARMGYTDPPADSIYGFINHPGIVDYARDNFAPGEYQDLIAEGQLAPVLFWYRQSPTPLVAMDNSRPVTAFDPPQILSNMIRIVLDPEGRLVSLAAVPPEVEDHSVQAPPVDWQPLFEAAGLDYTDWTPAEPEWLPLVSFDERAAWTGSYRNAPSVPMFIEAAAWKGGPVHFVVRGPWRQPLRSPPSGRRGLDAADWIWFGPAISVMVLAGLLAWRNYNRGRADLGASTRLAAFILLTFTVAWLLPTHLVSLDEELGKFVHRLSGALLQAAFYWVLYVAVEPYVRSRWPQSLISWNRLLDGRIRDPLVGGHILVGTALGTGYALFFAAEDLLQIGEVPYDISLAVLMGPRFVVAGWLDGLAGVATLFTAVFLLFVVLRAIFRRTWLAVALPVVLLAALGALENPGTAALTSAAISALSGGFILVTLIRFGLLPMILGGFVGNVISGSPLTTDFSVWYAGTAFLGLGFVLLLALWSFRTALGGRKVLKEDFLENY